MHFHRMILKILWLDLPIRVFFVFFFQLLLHGYGNLFKKTHMLKLKRLLLQLMSYKWMNEERERERERLTDDREIDGNQLNSEN